MIRLGFQFGCIAIAVWNALYLAGRCLLFAAHILRVALMAGISFVRRASWGEDYEMTARSVTRRQFAPSE